MTSHSSEEVTRKHLQRKVRELHTHSYLTLLSIGQAVSFHLLAEEISDHRSCMFVPLGPEFPFFTWILAFETFVLLILVWNDFFMVISTYSWIPSLADATILFCLFATEVFMAKSIASMEGWLIASMFFMIFSLLAFFNTLKQSKKRPENMLLLKMTIGRIRMAVKMIAGLMVSLSFLLLLAQMFKWLYKLGVLFSCIITVLFVINRVRSWRRTKKFIEGTTRIVV
jgi:hypothetical protein